MQYIIFFLYSIGIHIGNLYIFIGSFFSAKLYSMREGRKKTFHLLKEFCEENKNAVWVHSASLGEFEQGKPLIDAIKAQSPNTPIILSFFSPSGYEIRQNYKNADLVVYLPSDVDAYAKKMIQIVQPSIFIFIKYELWWNLIRNLINFQVKTVLISSVFRDSDYFLKQPFYIFTNLLKKFDQIFVQDLESMNVLHHHDIKNVVLAGDTRIDSVEERFANSVLPNKFKTLPKYKDVFVYGSIWMSDMEVVKACVDYFKYALHILAPHDISDQNIERLKAYLNKECNVYSDPELRKNVIIIDCIGILFDTYALSRYVYIGGGFQSGIHNILEPAIFKKPIFFGTNYKKFNEANILLKNGACFSIENGNEVIGKVVLLEEDPSKYLEIQNNLGNYFEKHRGATIKILDHIRPYLNQWS